MRQFIYQSFMNHQIKNVTGRNRIFDRIMIQFGKSLFQMVIEDISDAIFLFVLKDPKTGNFLGERKLYLQTLFERSNEILHEKLEL